MSHLTDVELLRWRDRGEPADRDRVVGHLAECDRCGAAYAELIRAARIDPAGAADDAAGPKEVLDPRELRAAGYAAGRRPVFTLPNLAAAATLAAVAVGGVMLLRAPSEVSRVPSPAVRGTELVAVAPAGSVGWPVEFRWTSPVTATAYRVDVFDAGGQRVHSIRTAAEAAHDPALRERLRPGARYTFVVTALGPGDRVLLSSAPRAFVFAPER